MTLPLNWKWKTTFSEKSWRETHFPPAKMRERVEAGTGGRAGGAGRVEETEREPSGSRVCCPCVARRTRVLLRESLCSFRTSERQTPKLQTNDKISPSLGVNQKVRRRGDTRPRGHFKGFRSILVVQSSSKAIDSEESTVGPFV